MGLLLIISASLAWVLWFESGWIYNHWAHWLLG